MFRRVQSLLFGLLVVASAWFMSSGLFRPAIALAPSESLAQAVQEIEQLDVLRSGLAATLKDATEPPTPETMQEVCKPVGMKAKQISQEHGWQVKQISRQYRNPEHAPTLLAEKKALAKFRANPDLMGFWEPETVADQSGTRYYRRINVEASCLACHGSKDSHPQFIQDRYPQDLAFGFQEGDLRGMYAVFMPDLEPNRVPAYTGVAN
ncbi:Tll0287-like domain-containing protein [Lyngbya confervoides]|uniref:DUF3365 domain-containing protein n=1 Tax=Lyngbya confervoides BDU141951 TaxID=1574623 RepID=A0ABD4T1I5_9CYAN|nr:DUF3365 domain-containing protein [Lyngbya confervoides]MCM1982447.1 DUF3365 domain-containing protein [Lyngbya confervoides BDU141951]